MKNVIPSEGRWTATEGLPHPLGVSWVASQDAFNFALYSKYATSVRLLLFTRDNVAQPYLEIHLDPFKNKSGRIWHCRVANMHVFECCFYAYQVDGPEPGGGFELHAFHSQKHLFDPYAREIYFPPGFSRDAAIGKNSNIGKAALGVVEAGMTRDSSLHLGIRHESTAVIYELHVKSFTQHESSGVSESARGKFLGVVEKIPYLLELGVTIVEFMPVFQFDQHGNDFWGYMPMSFFAPHSEYAQHSAIEEFREMVKALHEANIEVIIDAVYNHTAEGGGNGPVFNLKAIDNSTYYLMNFNSPGEYANYSGTGNSLNCSNRYVRKMILDSMRFWVKEMGVDGFRFDLASIFARNTDGTINFDEPPIFGDISSDPDFDNVRMIAEPWDAGGGYALGRSFPGVTWLQWNGRFRDDIRRFVRGDTNMVGALMQRLYGSDDLFPDHPIYAYHAYQSVNYVNCHDGFTLYDLVSYNHKRNTANGYDNLDGPHENYSWNCGWEGDADVPAQVLALRQKQAKNLFALVLLANGTPMFRAGDEFLQSQGGNSNPHNQDNETCWLNWQEKQRHSDFFRFAKLMIAFRKRHASLGRSRFWREDVQWFGPQGSPDLSETSKVMAMCLNGNSQDDDDLYVMVNSGSLPVQFLIQDQSDIPWGRVIDTSLSSPHDIVPFGQEVALSEYSTTVAARSVVVLCRPKWGRDRTEG